MKDRLQKIRNNLIRWATNEDISYKIYLIWAVGVFLLVGLFGIYPLTRELITKYQVSRQMVNLNKDLQRKFNEVSDASVKIAAVGSGVSYLDMYLPENFELQNYMIDFITASGKAGFSLDTFMPMDQVGSAVGIYISLSGDGDLVSLIKNLEDMNRISEIQSINLSEIGATPILRLNITTYIMEKQ
jgi:Tfp pilus assembly protein PilO